MYQHHIVCGKSGSDTRFRLAANRMASVLPNCSKELDVSGMKWIGSIPKGDKPIVLHLIGHGSGGSFKLGTPQLIVKVGKQLLTADIPLAAVCIYACHSADDKGTGMILHKYFLEQKAPIPVVAFGKYDSVSCSNPDDDDNEYESGAVMGMLSALIRAGPNISMKAFLEHVLTPGVRGSGPIEAFPPVLFGEIHETVKSFYGTVIVASDVAHTIDKILAVIFRCDDEDYELDDYVPPKK